MSKNRRDYDYDEWEDFDDYDHRNKLKSRRDQRKKKANSHEDLLTPERDEY